MKSRQRIRKTALVIVLGGLIESWNAGEIKAQVDVGVSFGVNIHSPADFYSPLAAYGTWVDVSPYGRCWRPADIVPEWRPYTVGHWEWTDAGWYWMSDEPWGWACCHYGSWVLDPIYGWVWIPAVEWAPAWVVWRETPDYIGWAPCGPTGVAVSDSWFAFVDVRHFHDHLGPRMLVFNDPRIFARSKPVGSFHRETRDFVGARRRIAFNPGPGVDPVQRATGTRFTPTPVRQLVKQTTVPDAANRNLTRPATERPRVTQQPAQPPAGREQQRLYKEAPQPTPTGRQEQRIYREAPAQRPAPQPQQPSIEVPRRQTQPQIPAPQAGRPLPPTIERGRGEGHEGQVRREESAARAAPAQRETPAAPAPSAREREKERDEK